MFTLFCVKVSRSGFFSDLRGVSSGRCLSDNVNNLALAFVRVFLYFILWYLSWKEDLVEKVNQLLLQYHNSQICQWWFRRLELTSVNRPFAFDMFAAVYQLWQHLLKVPSGKTWYLWYKILVIEMKKPCGKIEFDTSRWKK